MGGGGWEGGERSGEVGGGVKGRRREGEWGGGEGKWGEGGRGMEEGGEEVGGDVLGIGGVWGQSGGRRVRHWSRGGTWCWALLPACKKGGDNAVLALAAFE